jgi:hypothetical protein
MAAKSIELIFNSCRSRGIQTKSVVSNPPFPAQDSASGERIWRERVVGRTFQRSPALRASFAQSAVQVLVERKGIQSPAVAITIPDDRADRYIVRIVKDLLTHLYPEFDYSAHAFEVEQVTPSADNIKMLFKLFANDERDILS